MNRPALVILLVSCVCFGFAVGPGSVAGQDGTAERSLNTSTVSPGDTVEVTVTAALDGPASVDFADTWSPPVADISVVSVSFDRAGLGIAGPEEIALFSDGEVTADSIEIVYTLSVPADAEPGTAYEWEAAGDGDGSFLSVGEDDRAIGGDQRFDVAGDNGDGDGGTGDDGDGGTDSDGDGGTGDSGDGGTDSDGDGGTGDDGDGGTGDGGDGGTDSNGDGSGPGFGPIAVVLAVGLLVYSARRSDPR